MKAIIMAGGEGTRLRPLTCDCPKPMVPLMDAPVMEYALALLKKHGINDIGVTLQYLPNMVKDYFGDGSEFGVSMRYYVEELPLGTAGSVKQADEFLNETFCVMSGDGLTDCNLALALEKHKASGAMATMVLKKVEEPLDYGVVVTGTDGRVERFVEKPGWGEVFSDSVNTGIYILEPEVLKLVPEGKPYDFGRELFPLLVSMGEPVFGYMMHDYWCDIGDITAYLRAHMDILDGKVSLFNGGKKSGVIKSAGALVDKGAVLEGPCFIGENARIAAGARIGPYSVIGRGSNINSRSGVKRSVIWHGSTVQSGAQLRGCIVQNNATVGLSGAMFEESVLASGSLLGEGATLMPGVKVWPNKQIADGEKLMKNLIWGAGLQMKYEGGFISLGAPVDALKGADALVTSLKPNIVMLGRDSSLEAASHSRAAAAALMAEGVQTVDIGTATLAQMGHAMRTMGGDAALYIESKRMQPLGKHGLPLIKVQRRKLQQSLMRDDHQSPFAQGTLAPIFAPRTDIAYMHRLIEAADWKLLKDEAPPVAIYSENPVLLSMAERVMRGAGLTVRAEWELEMMDVAGREIGVFLTPDGSGMTMAERGGRLSETENQMILYWTAIRMGMSPIIVPQGTTGGIKALAEKEGAAVQYVSSERAEFAANLLGTDVRQLELMTDGIYSALMAVQELTRAHMTLGGLRRTMPVIHRNTREVPIALRDKGPVLGAVARLHPECDLTDGIKVEDERGWAWISSLGDARQCLVVSESYDSEIARELCDMYSKELEQLVKDSKDSKQR